MADLEDNKHFKSKCVYRSYTQAELDIQYSARGTAPDGDIYRNFISENSARVRKEMECLIDVPYGPTAAEVVNVFPAEKPNSPIVYFIHGGYWRSSSQKDVDLYAEALVPAGCAYVTVNYLLAPEATIDEIVRQCRAGLAWAYNHAGSLNGDPDNIHVVGRSAGGHLTGMMLADGWRQKFDLPNNLIKSACAKQCALCAVKTQVVLAKHGILFFKENFSSIGKEPASLQTSGIGPRTSVIGSRISVQPET